MKVLMQAGWSGKSLPSIPWRQNNHGISVKTVGEMMHDRWATYNNATGELRLTQLGHSQALQAGAVPTVTPRLS